ncbi:MAG: hypothetical protein MUF07_08520 [Steroidobacteraceae bacterium]|jgi:hypothetical protein|nr:hypothetical protein [Steroidobacteraceae bacterium]
MATSQQAAAPREHVLADRWRVTTERLVEARSHFRFLNESESMDIAAMRRVARLVHDLELERHALARAMEQLER